MTFKKHQLGTVQKTFRGFPFIEFKDAYQKKCSLQISSLATEDALWLGIDEVEPKVLHGDARALGIKTDATSGWVDYPIPPEVQLGSRMHLKRNQVQGLINHLQKWLDTREF